MECPMTKYCTTKKQFEKIEKFCPTTCMSCKLPDLLFRKEPKKLMNIKFDIEYAYEYPIGKDDE